MMQFVMSSLVVQRELQRRSQEQARARMTQTVVREPAKPAVVEEPPAEERKPIPIGGEYTCSAWADAISDVFLVMPDDDAEAVLDNWVKRNPDRRWSFADLLAVMDGFHDNSAAVRVGAKLWPTIDSEERDREYLAKCFPEEWRDITG